MHGLCFGIGLCCRKGCMCRLFGGGMCCGCCGLVLVVRVCVRGFVGCKAGVLLCFNQVYDILIVIYSLLVHHIHHFS